MLWGKLVPWSTSCGDEAVEAKLYKSGSEILESAEASPAELITKHGMDMSL